MMMDGRRRAVVVGFLFFFSGLAALVYQVISDVDEAAVPVLRQRRLFRRHYAERLHGGAGRCPVVC